MKRTGNLWNTLVSDENLSRAITVVNRGHHWLKGHKPNRCTAWVEETLAERRKELRKIIEDGFIPKPPKISRRWDASAQKWREISEPVLWPDQYVHHALIQVLEPTMMRGMDRFCCGSIKGRGVHYGMKAIKKWMKKDVKGTKYCLTMDIRHFYQSLKPEVVMDRMRQLVKDHRVLDLVERVTQDGILIGAFTSQWLANTTLQPLDHLIREGGFGVTHYLRYMDNFTVFGRNKRKLRKLISRVREWLAEHGLEIKGDWQIFPTASRMPCALGYRYGRGYTLPRKHNLLRMKRCVQRYRKGRAEHKPCSFKRASALISRLGTLQHCNNFRLYKRLFRGEKLLKQLKVYIRLYNNGGLETWSMYLARRARLKFSRPKAIPTPS